MTPEQKSEWGELVADCRAGRWWVNCGGGGRKQAVVAAEAKLWECELFARLLGEAVVGFGCHLTGKDTEEVQRLWGEWQGMTYHSKWMNKADNA